jgi:hypothetical protein
MADMSEETSRCSCRDRPGRAGPDRLIRSAFSLLGLQTYFTAA